MKDRGPDRLMAWMQSLADEARLRLLHLLERHELGVAELCEIVQLPQSTVSRHLKVLSDEGWTRSRRQGTAHLYRVIDAELDADARKLWWLARDQTRGWSAVEQDEMRLERVLRARQTESQNFFAGAAAEWDRLRVEMYGSRFTGAALVSLIPEDYVVADLGCGTGEITRELSQQVKRVIAVDSSGPMLKAARKRVGERENVEFHRAQIEELPLDSGMCDAAMLVLVLSYIEEPARALAEVARILKAGGKVVVVDLLPHDREEFRRQMGQRHPGFSEEYFRNVLREAGFAEVRVKKLEPEKEAKGPGLFLGMGVK